MGYEYDCDYCETVLESRLLVTATARVFWHNWRNHGTELAQERFG